MYRVVRLLLALSCVSLVHAADDARPGDLKKFVEAARAAAASRAAATETSGVLLPPRSPDRMLPYLLESLESPTPQPFEQQIRTLTQVVLLLTDAPELRTEGERLLDSLRKEHEQNLATYRSEVRALLQRAANACLQAARAADLDDLLKTLAPYQRPHESFPGRSYDPALQQRAAQMYQFVSRWQEYMVAREARDTDRTRQAAYQLQSLVDPELVPRSKILELSTPAASAPAPSPRTASKAAPESIDQFEALLDKTASVEDLMQVITHHPRRHADYNFQEFQRHAFALSSAREALLKTGRVTTELFHPGTPFSPNHDRLPAAYLQALQRARVHLQAETIHAVLKNSGLAPASDETTDAYVFRVAQAAAQAENWEYALRTLEFYQMLFIQTRAPGWIARELDSCNTYVAARRFDDAKQHAYAVAAYRKALQSTGQLTPLALITARLAEIKSAHPGEFALASNISLPTGGRFGGERPPTSMSPAQYLQPITEHPFIPKPSR